jgi:hypothetical protein
VAIGTDANVKATLGAIAGFAILNSGVHAVASAQATYQPPQSNDLTGKTRGNVNSPFIRMGRITIGMFG